MSEPTSSPYQNAQIWLRHWQSMGLDCPSGFHEKCIQTLKAYSKNEHTTDVTSLATQWLELFASNENIQQSAGDFVQQINKVVQHAQTEFASQLNQTSGCASVREQFDIWIDCCERAYADIAGSDDFSEQLAQFFSAAIDATPPDQVAWQRGTNFRPGPPGTGISDRELLLETDGIKLYCYKPKKSVKTKRQPLLIVYALVNRPYMLDLQRDKSMISSLLEKNLDVYLIDWGYPGAQHQQRTLDDHLNGYLDAYVNHVCRITNSRKINLLGVCQGGTFSLCYAAMNPNKIRRLITMVTPVDFHCDDFLLSHWVRKIDVATLVDKIGNIPGGLLNLAFVALKPFRLGLQKYIHMMDFADDTARLNDFIRMEKWINDSPDQCAKTFEEFVALFYRDNRLVSGDIKIGSQAFTLGSITCPVLNIYARDDHLVPPSSSMVLGTLVGSRHFHEYEFPGGHIGLFVSRRGTGPIAEKIAQWIKSGEKQLQSHQSKPDRPDRKLV